MMETWVTEVVVEETSEVVEEETWVIVEPKILVTMKVVKEEVETMFAVMKKVTRKLEVLIE